MILVPPRAEFPMRPSEPGFGSIDARSKRLRISREWLAIILVVTCIFAPISSVAATIKHQASGTIQSHTPSGIVLLKTVGKHQSKWDFVLTHDTQIPDGVNRGVRVTIYYHEDNGKRIADRVKVVAVSGAK
jgi:hypothetical protein